MHQLDGGMQPGDLSATGLSRGETDVRVAQPVLPAVPEDPGQERNVHGEWQHLPGGHCYDVVNQTKKSRFRGYYNFLSYYPADAISYCIGRSIRVSNIWFENICFLERGRLESGRVQVVSVRPWPSAVCPRVVSTHLDVVSCQYETANRSGFVLPPMCTE